jgi:hypothetical protein
MKTATITVRLPAATRRRLEELAKNEGRSLSQQVERLIAKGMEGGEPLLSGRTPRGIRSLSGALAGGRVPTLSDFRKVRSELSASLARRIGRRDE